MPTRIQTKGYWLQFIALVFMISNVHAQGLSISEQKTLAHRFRPYIKTTLDGGSPEQIHPCNWQWFVGHCTYVANYKRQKAFGSWGTGDPWPDGDIVLSARDLSQNPARLIEPANSDLRFPTGAGIVDMGYAMHLDSKEYHAGEDWDIVVHLGHGVYAHVEEVAGDKQIVNIEYSILWAYNDAYMSQHNGDITTIVVVYDRGTDLLTRVTYSVHGVALESFRLANPITFNRVRLLGRDDNGNVQTISAMQINPRDIDQYQMGDWTHSPGDAYVYLAQDPVSMLYEHPVAFAEHGAHELWPNPSGSVKYCPAHTGDGYSFLPDSVQVLGTLEQPNVGHEPFLYYNGIFGTDPQAIVLHKTWYWPQGRGKTVQMGKDPRVIPYDITDSRGFSDQDPYLTLGGLPWPPQREFTQDATVLYVNPAAPNAPTSSVINNSLLTFPDVMTAISFVPAGGVLAINTGKYPGRAVLSRACTLVARGGIVTMGGS